MRPCAPGCGSSARGSTPRSPVPAPQRDDGPAGGRRRPGGEPRGHLRGAGRALRPVRLRGLGDLRPRQGRQHPLHAHRPLRDDRAAGPLRGVHRGPRRPRAGQRWLAQGRARHGPGDGALRQAPVRQGALRGDARGQAPRRPARPAQPRGDPHRGPGRAPAAHQARALRRGGGRPLRRVRLLRARLPLARPDPDTAAAHRRPPRHPQRRARRRQPHRREPRTRLRPTQASRPARWTACAAPPARCRSTPGSS